MRFKLNPITGFLNLIDTIVETGTTFPSNPDDGKLFIRTNLGHTLFVYNDTAGKWIPIKSNAPRSGSYVNIYVDPVNGTDDQDHGHGTGTDAYKSVNYAHSQLPFISEVPWNINLASGTYTEDIYYLDRNNAGEFRVFHKGSMDVENTYTATGGTAGTSTTQATVTVTGAGWVVDEHKNKWIQFSSGASLSGYDAIITSNTADTLTLVGILPTAPTNESFKIGVPGVIFDVTGLSKDNALYMQGCEGMINYFEWCHFKGADAYTVHLAEWGMMFLDNCIVEGSGGAYVSYRSLLFLNQTLFDVSSNGTGIVSIHGGLVKLNGCKIQGVSTADSSIGLHAKELSFVNILNGSEFEYLKYAVVASGNSCISFESGNSYTQIKGKSSARGLVAYANSIMLYAKEDAGGSNRHIVYTGVPLEENIGSGGMLVPGYGDASINSKIHDGDVLITSGNKLYLEGTTASNGDTYILYQNNRIEFYVNNVLEGYIDATGFVST